MNECEQLHPLLRGYLNDSLSARDRRMVARHLNLCASARKELDRLRGGAVKAPAVSANPPSEPWDLKILRWLFKPPKPSLPKETEIVPKKQRPPKETVALPPIDVSRKPSSFKPILGILLLFVALAFLTHFIQNAGDNTYVKGTKRWLSQHGIHAFGISPSLDMVLDLTGLPQWGGPNAPVAFSYDEIISDEDHYNLYWRLLEPGLDPPAVDFSKNDLVVFFTGQKPTGGYSVRFKRMENYADKTILWYDDLLPSAEQLNTPPARSWVLQMVPKPAQLPVLIQKIQ